MFSPGSPGNSIPSPSLSSHPPNLLYSLGASHNIHKEILEEGKKEGKGNYISAVIEAICRKQLAVLRKWTPQLDTLSSAKKNAIWKICIVMPSFTNFNKSSFAATVANWDVNPIKNMTSISVLYSAILFLQDNALLPEIPLKETLPADDSILMTAMHVDYGARQTRADQKTEKDMGLSRKKPAKREANPAPPIPQQTAAPLLSSNSELTICDGCNQWLRYPQGAEIIRCPKCSSIIVHNKTSTHTNPTPQPPDERGVKLFFHDQGKDDSKSYNHVPPPISIPSVPLSSQRPSFPPLTNNISGKGATNKEMIWLPPPPKIQNSHTPHFSNFQHHPSEMSPSLNNIHLPHQTNLFMMQPGIPNSSKPTSPFQSMTQQAQPTAFEISGTATVIKINALKRDFPSQEEDNVKKRKPNEEQH